MIKEISMPKQRKYTDEDLIEAVKTSFSIRQVLQKLGKSLQGGGSYGQIQKDFIRLNLDTSHFLGKGYLKGKTHNRGKKIELVTILVENSTYACNSTLKRRLIKENKLENICQICNSKPEWNNKPLVLIFDHINGNNRDNRLENLRLICPNCNSQLDTFAGRNKKSI